MTPTQRLERIETLRQLRWTLVDRQHDTQAIAGKLEVLIDRAHTEIWVLLNGVSETERT